MTRDQYNFEDPFKPENFETLPVLGIVSDYNVN